MMQNQKLLAEYVENGSEAAFRELVLRYTDFVYSTALRLTCGDSHLAEDVSQSVFVDLARKARTLPKDLMLGGWLHRHTCYVAATAMRGERRRQAREGQATQMNAIHDHSEVNLAQVAPILDEAINQLSAKDRVAILLRFFEQRDLRSVGEVMGTSENTARMRVTRALEKLHSLLKNRGVAFSTTALGAALASEAVTAAPAGLTVSFSSAALATAAAGTGTTLTALKFMTMTKLKLGVIGAIMIAAGAGSFVIQHQAQVKLREENDSMRQRMVELVRLRAENERLSTRVIPANSVQPLSKDQFSELLRLRGEVGVLRRQKRELESLVSKEKPTAAALPAQPSAAALPFQLHLVVDEPEEDAQSMTNHVKAPDGETLQEVLYVQKAPLLDYTAINSANVVADPSGAPQIEILFTDQGREQFAKITKENINKRIAIAIDGQSYSAPVVKSEITEGKAVISGSFTEERARELTAKINDALSHR